MTTKSFYSIINRCRVCKNNNFIEILSFKDLSMTGIFPKRIDQFITKGPLTLIKCNPKNGCGLVQLKESYDISEMYGENYGYMSSLNDSMLKHLQSKANKVLSYKYLSDGDVIIDIGSNDGSTLMFYPENKFKLFGFDPSAKKFQHLYSNNINLIIDFFSYSSFSQLKTFQKAKVITSYSMFYDLEDPISFAKDIYKTLEENGIWIFEQSYLPEMLKQNSFDTICHEHLEYYSIKQVKYILDKANLIILDIDFNNINGGSFSITAGKKNLSHIAKNSKISELINQENKINLDEKYVYDNFINNIEIAKSKSINFLIKCKKDDLTVCGLGASTKGNTLLQYFGINKNLIKSIGEINHDKFNSYTPGSKIPILNENEMLKTKPDFIFVLPWHFKEFFINSNKYKGLKLVFPLPNFEIYEL